MKKRYERPVMNAQTFVANEYVASGCGETGSVYKFKCDAGRYGTLLGYNVYTNGKDGVAGTKDDVRLGSYTPCSEEHEASTEDEFLKGYMCKDLGFVEGKPYPVVIWRGEDGKNIHCTTNLDIENWETTRS